MGGAPARTTPSPVPGPGAAASTARSTSADALRRLLVRSGGRPSVEALADALRTPGAVGAPTGIPVPGPLGSLLPGRHLPAGAVVGLTGAPGLGRTSVAFELLAATTAAGRWAAVVDPGCVLGACAAAAAGVDLARVAVVRGVTTERWPTVVAALLDGVAVVVADPPAVLAVADARRLTARARERRATLVVTGAWPERPTVRLRAVASTWYGLQEGEGLLTGRLLTVEGDDRAGRPRRVDLGPGPPGSRPPDPGAARDDAAVHTGPFGDGAGMPSRLPVAG